MNKTDPNPWSGKAHIPVPAFTGISGNNVHRKASLPFSFAGSVSNCMPFSVCSQPTMPFPVSAEMSSPTKAWAPLHQSSPCSSDHLSMYTNSSRLPHSQVLERIWPDSTCPAVTVARTRSLFPCWHAFRRQWPWHPHLCILPSPVLGPSSLLDPH